MRLSDFWEEFPWRLASLAFPERPLGGRPWARPQGCRQVSPDPSRPAPGHTPPPCPSSSASGSSASPPSPASVPPPGLPGSRRNLKRPPVKQTLWRGRGCADISGPTRPPAPSPTPTPRRCTGYDELTLLSPVSSLFSTLHAPFPEGRARGLCSILSIHACPPLTGPRPLTPGAQTLPDTGSRTWLLRAPGSSPDHLGRRGPGGELGGEGGSGQHALHVGQLGGCLQLPSCLPLLHIFL